MASSVDVDRIRGFTMKDMKGLKVEGLGFRVQGVPGL